MNSRVIFWLLGLGLGGGAIYYYFYNKAPTGCPAVGSLDVMTARIRSGEIVQADAEKIATSYAAAGCPEAEAAVRTAMLVAKANGVTATNGPGKLTSTPLTPAPEKFGIADTAANPWSKYSDTFTNDPSVTAMEKVWRDRILAILEKDPRTLSSSDLTDAKTLYKTLQSYNAGVVTEVLRKYIALADPSYGQAGDPQIFPVAPIVPIFSSVGAMNMNHWTSRSARRSVNRAMFL